MSTINKVHLNADALPFGWRRVRLGEIGFAYSGLSGKSKEDFGSGSLYVPYKNVFSNTFLNITNLEQVEVKPNESQNKVRLGDILLTISSETPEEVGMSTVVDTDVTQVLYLNSFCFGFRPTTKCLDVRYSGYAFRSSHMRRRLIFLAQGSTRFNISKGRVLEIELPIPPLQEQEKIAAILKSVDDKLDVIARKIAAAQTLKQGLMQTLFSQGIGTQNTDGCWVLHTEFKDSELGKVPLGWSVLPLGAIAKECRTRNGGNLDDALLCGVLKDQGLVPMRERVKGASTDRCRLVESGGFAYNPMRINIGSIARNLRDHAVMVSPDYVVFSAKPEVLLSAYLDHFRRSDAWQQFVGRSGDGGVRIRIYFDDLAQLKMKVPPLNEQTRIVEVLDCMSDKLNHLKTMQSKFDDLKRGLMQKLLTGQLRVSLIPSQETSLAA